MKLLVSVALLAFVVSAADASRGHSICGAFTTCSECACSTSSYNVRMECEPGCVWVSDTSTCFAAAEAPAGVANVSSAFAFPGLATTRESRAEELRRGRMLCPPRIPPTAFPLVIATLVALAIGLCHAVGYFVISKFYYRGSVQGLMDIVKDAVQPSETVLWQEVTSSDKFTACNLLALCTAYIAILGVQPLLRLYYFGLPNELDDDWGFAFFFPTLMLGALGGLVEAVAIGTMGSPAGKQGVAFAITSKSFVYAKGHGTRPHQPPSITRMTDMTLGSVQSVTLRSGKFVDFVVTNCSGSSNQYDEADCTIQPMQGGRTHITLTNLHEPVKVFQLLRSFRAGVVAATAVDEVTDHPKLASVGCAAVNRRTAGGYTSVSMQDS